MSPGAVRFEGRKFTAAGSNPWEEEGGQTTNPLYSLDPLSLARPKPTNSLAANQGKERVKLSQ